MSGLSVQQSKQGGNNAARQIDKLKNAARDKSAELYAVVNYLINDIEELGYVTPSTIECARRVQSDIRK